MGKYSASRFANGIICFNIVDVNTKLSMSVYMHAVTIRHSLPSLRRFQRSFFTLTTLLDDADDINFSANDCLLIRLSPLRIPLSSLIVRVPQPSAAMVIIEMGMILCARLD